MILAVTSGAFAHPKNHNDNSCDITVAPAATLLLPFFDVDIGDSQGDETTLFTITNVTRMPQIAHVTVWTDWGYPLLAFNVLLTGYDVQAISLSDVFNHGRLAPVVISPLQGGGIAPPLPNDSNPNIARDAFGPGGVCSSLPAVVPSDVLAAIRTALTTGLYNPSTTVCANRRVGGTHTNARGYLTIDVVSTCSTKFADNPDFIRKELLFDNVLIGDYQQVDGHFMSAQAEPMVHIRAIPEGGPAGSYPGTNLPYTFYDRYTVTFPPATARTFDRRQPLPSSFAARWIDNGRDVKTHYKLWREGLTVGTQSCADAQRNSAMPFEAIRFDEQENSFSSNWCHVVQPFCAAVRALPAAARVSTSSFPFPDNVSNAQGGWMYINLSNGGSDFYSANGYSGVTPFAPEGSNTKTRPSQGWVIVSMSAEGRFALDLDAAQLGNGCTPVDTYQQTHIGPAQNETPSGFISRPPH